MSLGLNEYSSETNPIDSKYSNSPIFLDSVNDARFVKTFGILALIVSIILFIGPGVSLGAGIAVAGYGKAKFYRTIGIGLIMFSVLGFMLPEFLKPIVAMLGLIFLSAGILIKSLSIKNILKTEGLNDPDWQITQKRANTGIICTIISVVVSVGWLGLFLLSILITSIMLR
jgi:hypothetical protein